MRESLPWDVYYPRPQLKREEWFNLNGSWEFYIDGDMEKFHVNVPYPPESELSGFHRRIPEERDVTYIRSFTLPEGFIKDRVLLHFGAVDQVAEVYLNGRYIGSHKGGYTHFSFDVTEQIRKGENRLVVKVSDHLDDARYPYGKQRHKNAGMWYTPVTGIWQTVWLESVPETYIRELLIRPELDSVDIEVKLNGETSLMPVLSIIEGDEPVSRTVKDGHIFLKFDTPRNWTPEGPYLYTFRIQAGEDEVTSYFALRSLGSEKVDGIPRLLLNGKPYYFHGVLDQGYFDDGIYTPKDPESYRKDIMMLKSCGFNMLRKHIKVEPDYFYYLCDIYGMAVFQDMVNNGSYSYLRDTVLPTLHLLRGMSDKFLHKDEKTRNIFLNSVSETVHQVFNFPCIVLYTIFNEGWGQFDGNNVYHYVKKLDDSRLIDTASGWFRVAATDVSSEHIYFKDPIVSPSDKPVILSEYGGYTYAEAGQLFETEKAYGYGKYEHNEAYQQALERPMEDVVLPQIPMGLCADIYTQLSDVEGEINGLFTFDRKVLKVNLLRMKEIGERMRSSL